ncbi:RNA polymerase sigma factor [Catelliglobosispora koreensis]|uniref:RNA polymerase sigma factor n=1 Tax=Catelliglobosispora koreensis TaxID=129052 RepID=UPI00036975AD|nr:DUF6596 domain-containing protein [Catelliglobosispora koreensis]
MLADVWAAERANMLATLVRRLGDLDLAEEALAEAAARALEIWPTEGVPSKPAGWLITTAWHRALDRLRREQTGQAKLALLANTPPSESEDDRLALIFGCCHPSLAEPVQVALTLNAVCGLTSQEIALAFLMPPASMAQRLVRAKAQLKKDNVRFTMPEPEDYPQRLPAVLSVIYLVFNEGYLASSKTQPQRRELAREALDLSRELARLMPGEPEVAGLTALIELQEARAVTRFDDEEQLVLLENQDRGLWDAALIRSATARLDRAMARRRPGPFQLQAAIAALHAGAPSTADTDWLQIHMLYSALHEQTGNPVALLNRAVATRYLWGPERALSDVDALTERLGSYRLFHATRGEMLQALGRAEDARAAWQRALDLATNPAERAFIASRLATASRQ